MRQSYVEQENSSNDLVVVIVLRQSYVGQENSSNDLEVVIVLC